MPTCCNDQTTRSTRQLARISRLAALICLTIAGLPCQSLLAQQIVHLKNGMQLEGHLGTASAFFEGTTATRAAGDSILLVDDGLRRIFTNKLNIDDKRPMTDSVIREESFDIDQYGVNSVSESSGIGPIINATPFNEFGRRMMTIAGPSGPVILIQGIVRITPRYCAVKTVEADNSVYNGLEMRIATSSIPRETLSRIMRHHINARNASDRLKIVAFYQQAERYVDAETELKSLIDDFPEIAPEKERELKLMRQAWANQLVREIRNRIEVGQYEFAMKLIDGFPRQDVADTILLEVGGPDGLKEQIEKRILRRQQILDRLAETVKNYLADSKPDEPKLALVNSFHQEIQSELNINNIIRLAGFMTLSDDPSQTSDQNLSLAISGWLVGGDAATDNVEVALALLQVRDLVVQYLSSKVGADRAEIVKKLQATEGGTAKNIAAIIKNIKPYNATEPQDGPVGFYHLQAPGLGDKDLFDYWVQLPPDYDPYRRYPCVVTLNSVRTDEVQQIDWWAGAYDEDQQMRRGEASRRGYILIAPRWTRANQAEYNYSAQEHAAVLNCVRDAFTRFAIDTDRVFLSGHSMGGDAAWDIGLAHPDLWAGVIPITAQADKYISRYWRNARWNLPMYFVHGEKDSPRMSANNTDWTRYLTRGFFDVVVVEYQGRGREHFYEDIKNIYNWMDLASHKRTAVPEKFECDSMRPWDNFFWFMEVGEMIDSNLVLPQEWPKKGAKTNWIEGELKEQNVLLAKTSAKKLVVWLAPEYIDFDRPISINNRKGEVKPDPLVLLEDVRTRCDRQHPFWAVVNLSDKPWR